MLTIGLGGVKITIGNFEMAGVALSSLVGISLNLILPDELLKKADKKVKVSDKKEYIEIK
jgi:xanthine/uracil permease